MYIYIYSVWLLSVKEIQIIVVFIMAFMRVLFFDCLSPIHFFLFSAEFCSWWRMASEQENQLLFQFLVLVAWLERANTRGLEMDLLIHIRDAFFSDPDRVESALPLQDVHGAVQKVIQE